MRATVDGGDNGAPGMVMAVSGINIKSFQCGIQHSVHTAFFKSQGTRLAFLLRGLPTTGVCLKWPFPTLALSLRRRSHGTPVPLLPEHVWTSFENRSEFLLVPTLATLLLRPIC